MKKDFEQADIGLATSAKSLPDYLCDEYRLTGYADSISFPTTEEGLVA